MKRGKADRRDDGPGPFAALHWMTAGLFVAAGLEAATGERRGDYRARRSVRLAPLLAAPAAATAHALRAARPTRATRLVSQVLDGIAIGVGTIGVASSVYSALRSEPGGPAHRRRLPSMAPLAFCAVGVLAAILDDQEDRFEEERARLESRARWMNRIVPKRKARVDRIVIHA